MVRVSNPRLVELVLRLHSILKSGQKVSEELKKSPFSISHSGVYYILRKQIMDEKSPAKPVKRLSTAGKPKVRTPEVIKQVKRDLSGAKPLSQRKVANKRQVSTRTVRRIIKEDLQGGLRKKYRVHALSDKQAAQRLRIGPEFLEYLEGEKFKKIITVDECWIYLTNTGGNRKIYYEFKGEKTEDSWRMFWSKLHPEGVMCFMGVSWYGKTELRFVEPKAKINADYYCDKLLKPLFKKDIPALFYGRKFRPVFHHDNAPAHVAAKTQAFLQNTGIDFIPPTKWMGNSPDLALMDFCVNGIFKWELFDRQPKTLDGLKRVAREVWHNLDQETIRNAFRSWYSRVEMMIKNHGYHIEQLLNGKSEIENKEN